MSDDGSEDSTPPPARRKIKKIMLVSSSSGSESDGSVGAPSTRRKRMRVLSDGASSSGSDVVARRKRALPALRDSDAESDSSGWATERSDVAAAAQPSKASGFSSDSSEGNSDKCSICLLRFKDQEVGTPETCEHLFCLDCITEWSKNVNTCPVDRMTFNSIIVRVCAGGRVLRTEPVKVVQRRSSMDGMILEDPTPCQICGSSENEETMLLCDGCDLGYHMQCLTPPLTEVPVEQWFCSQCDDLLLDGVEVSELDDLFLDLQDLDLPDGPRQVALRQPLDLRRSRRGRAGGDTPSTSRDTPTRAPRAGSSGAPRRRASAPRARRPEHSGGGAVRSRTGRKPNKRRRKKKGARAAARRAHVRASVRARLDDLRRDHREELIQTSKASSGVQALSISRQRAGIPALRLFGSEHDLDYFTDDEGGFEEGGGPALARPAPSRPTTAAARAYRQARRKMSIQSPPRADTAPDLLSSILESQAMLHDRRATVSLDSDGRLDIRLNPRRQLVREDKGSEKKDDRVDVSKPCAVPLSRSAPLYGGGGRSGGGGGGWGGAGRGWGGGYRGGRVPPAAPRHDSRDNGSLHNYQEAGVSEYGRRGPPDQGDYPRRHSFGEPWRQYGAARRPPAPRPPPPTARHNFGPLPAPPEFRLDRPDEGEDRQLVIDTDNRYDPTEPTNDDDESEEEAPGPAVPPLPAPPAPPLLPPPAAISLLAGLDPNINVPPNVLDTAVRQVLEEHRGLIGPTSSGQAPRGGSDDDSDGDCPNFSIYSATSVHIASSSGLEPPLSFEDVAPTNTALRTREDEYKEKVSKRCPITTNTRNPIKIKINTPSLIKRVSLYDDEEGSQEGDGTEVADVEAAAAPEKADDKAEENAIEDTEPVESQDDVDQSNDVADIRSKEEESAQLEAELPEKAKSPEDIEDEPATPDLDESINQEGDDGDKEGDDDKKEDDDIEDDDVEKETMGDDDAMETPLENGDKTDAELSEDEHDDTSEKELAVAAKKDTDNDALEKMTESISETEDERSYTPCLDENKSKDTSLETEKDKGIEGLDTEMISEEEGNGIFSDEDKHTSPPPKVDTDQPDDSKKKKKKESKKENKDKKGKKKNDILFKKLSTKGKERNYRDKDKDKDKDKEKSKKERRSSEERKKRKEKRKDLERYDVRTLVSEKRKRVKDAFGRDVSPQREGSGASRSPSAPPRRRGSMTPRRASISPRRSSTPRKTTTPRRRSVSPRRRSISPLRRRSISPLRRRSISPLRRRSISPRKRTVSPRRRSISLRGASPIRRRSITPRRKSITPRRKSPSPPRGRKRRSTSRRKRRRSGSRSPKPKTKKKKRARSAARLMPPSPRRKSPRRKRAKRTPSPSPPPRLLTDWSPPSVDSRLLSPRTPPPGPSPPPPRRAPVRHRHGAGPSKEVFTSGDNILVSVSFKEQERERAPGDKRKRREARRDKRRKRRRAAAAAADTTKPVAIIDLERSPFRELTPSPKNVIVLSDSDHGEKEAAPTPAPEPLEHAHVGPKTPPEPPAPLVKFSLPPKPAPAVRVANPLREETAGAEVEAAGPATPPDSPDAYDPFEPTRSASASPAPPAPASPPASPPRPHITLEAAQKTNLSADDVIDRRPISPIEKVMALLQSTRDVSPEPPPGDSSAPPCDTTPVAAAPPAAAPAPAPAPRIVLPEPRSAQPPKLFLAKPSPIKSNPVKPMQATKISRLPLPITVSSRRSPDDDSPYSPGSSDFGDLFEPPGGAGGGGGGGGGKKRDAFDSLFGDGKPRRRGRNQAAKVPVKLNRKKGKTQVGVKIDEDNLKILDDLPSSAVEMQVKSKFLKKLNRQERVVEEVKLVLKPHYNKKHVTKDEYKDILRRTVPKICHNKSGEINPTKIQALVEAYVKKIRKKHKLGLA